MAQQDIEKALVIECKEESDHYERAIALILANRISDALGELEIAFTDLAMRASARSDDLIDPIRNLPEFNILLNR